MPCEDDRGPAREVVRVIFTYRKGWAYGGDEVWFGFERYKKKGVLTWTSVARFEAAVFRGVLIDFVGRAGSSSTEVRLPANF